jgi:hypothetical protein
MVQWYYKGPIGNQVGPVSADELRQLAEAGHIVPDTLVRREADAEWAPARMVRGLFAIPHVPEPSGRASPTFMQKVKGLFAKRLLKMRHGPGDPGTDPPPLPPSPPSLPGQGNRMLIPALLSVLIAIASVSVVVQLRILDRLSSVPVTITNGELDVNVKNYELGVNVTNDELDVNVKNEPLDVNVENSTLDVNVENTELDVNVENTELDVKMENHGIVDGDPIPVKVVR